MQFDLQILIDSIPKLLSGLAMTVELMAISLTIGGVLAIGVALARLSANPAMSRPATVFISFFRGTPLLVQIYLVYYGSGQFSQFFDQIGLWGVLREAYWCAIITFSLNTAAYTAEILRGGIQGVPHGEIEAARACGMNRLKLYTRIIMPRAYRIALPAYGNEIIFMLKGSALASIITIFDLMGTTRVIFSRTFALEVFLYAGILYLLLTWGISWIIRYLEYRLTPDLRPPPDLTPGSLPLPARNT
jgi:His/Glu/Gln/Arg/opine family amino acid ABC transporter permease subunit